MDIQQFLNIIKRSKWILVFVPIITLSVTYYLVLDLPKEYSSQSLISTGLADQSQRIVVSNGQMDYYAINQQFENIIEFLKMKKNINMLSYKLILHDLEDPDNSFNPIIDDIAILDSVDRLSVIEKYKSLMSEGKIITPEDNQQYKLFDFVQLMGYGEKSILKKLEISRKDNSDFIQVEYRSNSPYLSVYVVNSVANDFILSYKDKTNKNQNNSKILLDSLLQGKEISMNEKNAQVKSFQVKNNIINLSSQADILSAQIAAKDAQRATTVGEIQSLQGAIQGIDDKLKSKNSELISANIVENNQIIAMKNQLQKANERYVDNNFQPQDAHVIDSLQAKLSKLIASSTSSTSTDPRVFRQNLIQQKLTMEVDLNRAKSGLSVILNDLAKLRIKYNQMVPNDAGMKNYEREAEVATKEYLNALDLYNQNNVVVTTGIRPQLVQAGVINEAEPSKQYLYVGLAGVGSLGTCMFILVISSLLDRRIRTSDQLSFFTQKRVIGQINNIVPNNKDLKTVWEESKSSENYTLYKDLIRSLRFEVDNVLKLDNKQIIGVTGIHDNSGSSFISSSLAYSFAMTKKRVLLIGGDYVLDKSSKVKELPKNQFFDSFIVKREIVTDEFITKLTTNSNNESLLEIYNEDTLRNGFDELKKEFDVIIVDVQSLKKIHLAKEWLMFVDKSIAIFPAGVNIGPYEKQLISFMNKQESFIGWVLNKTKIEDLGLLKQIRSN